MSLESSAPSGGVRIRRADTTDAAALATIAARLFQETFGSENAADDMQQYLAATFSPELQAQELADANRAVWLVELAAHECLGYASMCRGSAVDAVRASRPAELERIYLDRRLHGTGAAARLLDTCVTHARAWRADVVWLGVWERNARAIAFYEKSGFTRVGAKTFQLGGDTQTDVVMQKPVYV